MINKKIIKILKICIIFLFGFFSANLVNSYGDNNIFEYGLADFSSLLSNQSHAPSDFVKENQIQVYPDKIVINVKDASVSSYAPTGSMKPLLDENSNGIRIIPESEKDIHVGDVITYEDNGDLIIHRVVEIGKDAQGTYFITKGDNNSISDGKIRFKDIKYITIGVIW